MKENSQRRLKVLLGCYACDPFKGSEPGMGWNFVRNIAKHHDVHAIVEEGEFRERLESFSAEHPEAVKNITFHFVPRKHHHTLRKIWPPSYYWFYRAWHKRAYKLAVELDKKENFDIVHQVNMAGYREPGYLWKLNKPFIWGPLGGLNNTAWCLLPGVGLYSFIHFGLRNILNSVQLRYSYAAKTVSQVAHSIFVSDPNGMATVRQLWKREPRLMCEIGTEASNVSLELPPHQPGTPLRICWVGQFIPCKSLQLLLRALPLCKNSVEVEILGSGVMGSKWKKLTAQLGLEKQVCFRGSVPREEVTRMMQSCHLMCITSIHEGGTSSVSLEALQNGLPILALNHCGYATVIDDSCGIKIPIQTTGKISQNLAKEIDRLAEDEELRQRLARGAVERSKAFTWDAKIELLNRVYAEAYEQGK